MFFNIRLTLQKTTQASDDRGAWTTTWADVVSFDCSLQPNSQEWAIAYQKIGRDTTHRLFCDTNQGGVNMTEEPRDGDATYRIKHGDRYFEIEAAVDVAEQGRMTRMELVERDEGWVGD